MSRKEIKQIEFGPLFSFKDKLSCKFVLKKSFLKN